MDKLPLNDYFAMPRLSPSSTDDLKRLTDIISAYEMNGVKEIYIAYPFSLNESVDVQIYKCGEMLSACRSVSKRKILIRSVSVASLTDELLAFEGLQSLSFSRDKEQLIYLYIPPSVDTDMIRKRLHALVFKHKMTPVIVGAEKVTLTVPEDAEKSIWNIPNAVYQIDFCSLSSKRTRDLVSQLILSGKRVVFGTGDKFDVCLYSNPSYYTKLLSMAIGADRLGLFTLRHNRVFR